jgi:hypothetical protein
MKRLGTYLVCWLIALSLFAVGITLASCGTLFPPRAVVDLGERLVDDRVGLVQWTPDSKALVYSVGVDGGMGLSSPKITRINLIDRSQQTISLEPIVSLLGLMTSRDGQTLYYYVRRYWGNETDQPRLALYRHSLKTDQREVLLTGNLDEDITGVEVSSNDDYLVYDKYDRAPASRNHELHRYTLATAENIVLVTMDSPEQWRNGYAVYSGQPFSPDGSRLVVSEDFECTTGNYKYAIITLATSEVNHQTITLGSDSSCYLHTPYWTPQAPQIIDNFLDDGRVNIHDLSAATKQSFKLPVGFWASAGIAGGKLVTNASECLKESRDCGLFGCYTNCVLYQNKVGVLDLGTGTHHVIAQGDGFFTAVLSPDGNKCAYTYTHFEEPHISDGLYIDDLPK